MVGDDDENWDENSDNDDEDVDSDDDVNVDGVKTDGVKRDDVNKDEDANNGAEVNLEDGGSTVLTIVRTNILFMIRSLSLGSVLFYLIYLFHEVRKRQPVEV